MAFSSFLPQNFILPVLLQSAAFLRWDIPAAAVLCAAFAMAGGYFAFRYFALKRALREMHQDLLEIQKDVARNQILHLPLPNRTLEQVMESVNGTLEEARRQRMEYEKREAEFQKQIEDISHDLRTPLTVILGYLAWMKRDTLERRSGMAESLEILERNARAMERLVSQFYAFSQLNARDYSLEIREVDVCRLLRESLAGHWQMLKKARLRLESHLPEHPVMVRGNKDALERIFSNMLQNAGRYAHSYLDIHMSESCGLVQVLFQNDSVKLREDDIPHLFNRFYKNDVSRSKGGSGLGLTIAKSLAEAMGGTLTAQALPCPELPSGYNAGDLETIVCFTLTLTPAAPLSQSVCPEAEVLQ